MGRSWFLSLPFLMSKNQKHFYNDIIPLQAYTNVMKKVSAF